MLVNRLSTQEGLQVVVALLVAVVNMLWGKQLRRQEWGFWIVRWRPEHEYRHGQRHFGIAPEFHNFLPDDSIAIRGNTGGIVGHDTYSQQF